MRALLIDMGLIASAVAFPCTTRLMHPRMTATNIVDNFEVDEGPEVRVYEGGYDEAICEYAHSWDEPS